MRYFIDTEFIEDGKTIDLISIGIVAEDGREFYAQNQDCNLARASDWVQANVFPFLETFDMSTLQPHRDMDDDVEGRWYTRSAIADELVGFCEPARYGKPEFWGYYSAYDHVALCQLFGTMMDLPRDWPMYTRDIKQLHDFLGNPTLPEQGKGEHHALADARWNKQAWECLQRLRVKS